MQAAITYLLTKMADDALILGHRNSEWTGLGPIMEEDIAFSSMAQDKIGHALGLYSILHEQYGTPDPDKYAFLREEKDFRCCHLVELPNRAYDFSLMRHFLFDHADALRYEYMAQSSLESLRPFAKKLKGEIKYHTLHANAWLTQLSRAGEDSYGRMQAALDECLPLALGMFEQSSFDTELMEAGIYPGEEKMQAAWLERIYPLLVKCALNMPVPAEPVNGGRHGFHTEHLGPLLDEMGAVFRLDPAANW
ncbi:phenylacetate-CoA oxygenase subunit PaaC [Chitinophaga sedimenti]|uniref:1,2-phenylacetyl-CoA epoxidase subunit PaaC n=1 Tax=Chitinophaga sedimenti TaxID=2033606 RepID=UPI0020031DAE|nr:1,2-phenylacetyl-CoA epoxidase subunit PaaC [Chitinophaga sedimenti]MCK7558634.1 phenylacetate-CoA oxygenase subunit PaaC [Chitinophaga sedimenti]